MAEGILPCPLFKNEKECPGFGKKYPDYIHLWVKFLIQNTVLRVFMKKISEIFPSEAFLSRVED